MHFSDAITEYCFDCKVRKLSPKSISNYQKQLKYLQRYMEQEFQIKNTYGRHTISTLVECVPELQSQGYEFVTVTELMPKGGVLDGDGVMRLPNNAE